MKNVFLRGIDEETYREVKVKASLLGITLSEAVNIALKEWLKKPIIVEDKKSDVKEIADRLVEKYLKKGVKGYIVIFNNGENHAICSSIDEAINIIRKRYTEKKISSVLIREIKPRSIRFLEIGGGLLEICGEI